jgi:hypothetical protein
MFHFWSKQEENGIVLVKENSTQLSAHNSGTEAYTWTKKHPIANLDICDNSQLTSTP